MLEELLVKAKLRLLTAVIGMGKGQDHPASGSYPFCLQDPQRQWVAAEQMKQGMVLRHRVRQLDHLRQVEGEQAAGAPWLRFIGIGVGEARIELEVHRADEPRVTQGRGGPETGQIMFARELLETR